MPKSPKTQTKGNKTAPSSALKASPHGGFKESKWSCPICIKYFDRKTNRDRHLRSQHPGEESQIDLTAEPDSESEDDVQEVVVLNNDAVHSSVQGQTNAPSTSLFSPPAKKNKETTGRRPAKELLASLNIVPGRGPGEMDQAILDQLRREQERERSDKNASAVIQAEDIDVEIEVMTTNDRSKDPILDQATGDDSDSMDIDDVTVDVGTPLDDKVIDDPSGDERITTDFNAPGSKRVESIPQLVVHSPTPAGLSFNLVAINADKPTIAGPSTTTIKFPSIHPKPATSPAILSVRPNPDSSEKRRRFPIDPIEEKARFEQALLAGQRLSRGALEDVDELASSRKTTANTSRVGSEVDLKGMQHEMMANGREDRAGEVIAALGGGSEAAHNGKTTLQEDPQLVLASTSTPAAIILSSDARVKAPYPIDGRISSATLPDELATRLRDLAGKIGSHADQLDSPCPLMNQADQRDPGPHSSWSMPKAPAPPSPTEIAFLNLTCPTTRIDVGVKESLMRVADLLAQRAAQMKHEHSELVKALAHITEARNNVNQRKREVLGREAKQKVATKQTAAVETSLGQREEALRAKVAKHEAYASRMKDGFVAERAALRAEREARDVELTNRSDELDDREQELAEREMAVTRAEKRMDDLEYGVADALV